MDLELIGFTAHDVLQAEARHAEAQRASRMKGKAIDIEESIARATTLKEEGNSLFKKGHHVAACKKYREGIAMFEKRRGRCLVAGADLATCKVVMIPLHLNLAACQLELDDFKMALKNARRVIELDQHNVKARFRAGKALWKQGEADEAHEVLQGIKTEDRTRDVKTFCDEVDKYVKGQNAKEKAVFKKMFD